MNPVGAFLRLIRWPNLAFILVTQLLFYFCIVLPAFNQAGMTSSWFLSRPTLAWLMAASVFIAAAGYIINDYFDLDIDQVNKPGQIVIQKFIKRRWAIALHLLISLTGIIITFVLGWKIGNWVIGPANILAVGLLLFYSTTFKKKLLIGNIIISLLTAWVIFVLYICELDIVLMARNYPYHNAMTRIFKLAVLYGGFAFVISLVREVVKDMEDIIGDAKFGCRTMPIVWGMPASKVFAGVWLVVLILAVTVLLVYAIMSGWWVAAVFAGMLIALPLISILRNLYRAENSKDFHLISTHIKLVMLAGILSMIFFKWHI